MILWWAEFTAIRAHVRPTGCGLDTPGRIPQVTKTKFLCLRSPENSFPAIYVYLILQWPPKKICPPGSSPQGSLPLS